MERWENRVAVVTGASSGIGAAIARYLANNKLVVVNLDRCIEGYKAVCAKVSPEAAKRMHSIKCDVRKEVEIKAAFKEVEKNYGPIAVLVNNAGVAVYTNLVTADNTEDMIKMVETNILAAVYCTREAFHSMKANAIDGHVFLINSICGHRVQRMPNLNLNLYAPTKHAMTALTEMYRQEFLDQNTKIKVTSISPGITATNLTKDSPMHITAELNPNDIAEALIYSLQTPPHVQVHDIIIKAIGETV